MRSAPGRPRSSSTSAALSGSTPEERSWSSIDSASRMPPSARRARSSMAAGSATRFSVSRMASSLAAISARAIGRKSKRCRRESTAGRILDGSVVQKMKTIPGGGSSSHFRRASQASFVKRCTSSRMRTLRFRSVGGFVIRGIRSSRTSSMRLEVAALDSTTSKVAPSVMAMQERQVPQGSPSAGARQLSALATMRAVEVLPVPRGPTKRRPCPSRPSATARRRVLAMGSWPRSSPKVVAR